ncbi:MAG: hypothetical protein PVF74_08220 [Anaerolineales bacterium]
MNIASRNANYTVTRNQPIADAQHEWERVKGGPSTGNIARAQAEWN